MTKQTLKQIATSSTLLALMLSATNSLGQGKLPARKSPQPVASRASQSASRPAQALASGASYSTFSYIDFPQSPYTYATGINSGAASSTIEIVGEYGPDDEAGFRMEVKGKNGTTYAFSPVNYHGNSNQGAFGVNDFGQVVGVFSTGTELEGYEYSKGKFTTIVVPFAGAQGTEPFGINNAGNIVGSYLDSSGDFQGFLLNGSGYMSFAYPDSTNTVGYGLNNNGDIVGYYEDSSGNLHGFLLSGGTYTSIDFPGATLTYAEEINDSGNIVGGYCLTSECATDYDGGQGYLLSGGVFQTINVPGANATQPLGLNNNGVIVGTYSDSRGGPGYAEAHSFLVFP